MELSKILWVIKSIQPGNGQTLQPSDYTLQGNDGSVMKDGIATGGPNNDGGILKRG